jgi:hypothetical protein
MTGKLDSLLNNLLGINNWNAYCINLDVATDRKKCFSSWASDIGLTFEFWKATDKNTLTSEDYKECDVVVNNEFKSPGATACRLSHLRLFRYLLKQFPNKEYFFVFEDDCGFSNNNNTVNKKQMLYQYIEDVTEYKTNWDMLLFGYHDTGVKQLSPISDKLNLVIRAHLAHATIYKRSVLENILYICDQQGTKQLPFDWITDILRELKSITIGPKHSIIDQIDNFSYILFNYGTDNNEKFDSIKIKEDLIRCCVQFPITINGKTEFNLNVNTLYGDAIFLLHNSIKSFVKNVKHLKNPVVIVAYDEKTSVPVDVLQEIENENNILALYINNPTFTSNKIISLNVVETPNIVEWKKRIDSHKRR